MSRRVVLLQGAFYWFDENDATTDIEKAQSGPFTTKTSAKWSLIGDLEASMSDHARFLWAQALARAGGPDADVDQLVFLAGLCVRGKASPEAVMKFAAPHTAPWHPYRRTDDPRSRAAGDRTIMKMTTRP